MRKLIWFDKVYLLPESMNEMTNEQLIVLSDLVADSIPIQDVKVKILFHCLNAQLKRMKDPNYFRVKIDGKTYDVTVDEVTAISSAFDFLYTKPDKKGNCFLDNRLTRCPYPSMTISGKTFFAPSDHMTDLIYDQYIYLVSFDVLKDTKPEAIYSWLGCMFRTDKSYFDKKDLNIESMRQIKAEVIILMIWFWIGSCRYIADKHPSIFPAADDSESIQKRNVYDDQQSLLNFMSKGDPEKKRNYKRDYLYDVLSSLAYMIELEERQGATQVD
jgi:hypothetical protein